MVSQNPYIFFFSAIQFFPNGKTHIFARIITLSNPTMIHMQANSTCRIAASNRIFSFAIHFRYIKIPIIHPSTSR